MIQLKNKEMWRYMCEFIDDEDGIKVGLFVCLFFTFIYVER